MPSHTVHQERPCVRGACCARTAVRVCNKTGWGFGNDCAPYIRERDRSKEALVVRSGRNKPFLLLCTLRKTSTIKIFNISTFSPRRSYCSLSRASLLIKTILRDSLFDHANMSVSFTSLARTAGAPARGSRRGRP